jgi:hypothetical protein
MLNTEIYHVSFALHFVETLEAKRLPTALIDAMKHFLCLPTALIDAMKHFLRLPTALIDAMKHFLCPQLVPQWRFGRGTRPLPVFPFLCVHCVFCIYHRFFAGQGRRQHAWCGGEYVIFPLRNVPQV